MEKVFKDGYLWDYNYVTNSMTRENAFGKTIRQETYPGGPFNETFVPHHEDTVIMNLRKK